MKATLKEAFRSGSSLVKVYKLHTPHNLNGVAVDMVTLNYNLDNNTCDVVPHLSEDTLPKDFDNPLMVIPIDRDYLDPKTMKADKHCLEELLERKGAVSLTEDLDNIMEEDFSFEEEY